MVAESKYAVSYFGECPIANRVSRSMPVEAVLVSIKFDNQPSPPALEIDNVAPDRCLTAEMKSQFTHFPQPLPQHDLLAGHRLSEFARNFICHSGKGPHPTSLRSATLPEDGLGDAHISLRQSDSVGILLFPSR